MVRVNGGGDPDPVPKSALPKPPVPDDLVLYKPKDTIKTIRLQDTRKINPATGGAFKEIGGKSIDVNPENVAAIVAHAKAKGVDPYTALAVSYQEQNLGNEDIDLGSNKDYSPDPGISDRFMLLDDQKRHENANVLVKALKDKMEYAKRLGFDKNGEASVLQAYNGYGKFIPRSGEKSMYGIPVSPDHPLDFRHNPVYGRTVVSLRDEILKKNPEIAKLVTNTPAFGADNNEAPAPKNVKVRIKK